jgi:hypothetical protein
MPYYTVYVLPANIKIMSITFRISSESVFYAGLAVKNPPKKPPKKPSKTTYKPTSKRFF